MAFESFSAVQLPSGVMRLIQTNPTRPESNEYFTRLPGGGVRAGRSVWNPSTGSYVDRLTGRPLDAPSMDRNSVLQRIIAGGGAGEGGGPALYGESYGQLTGAAQTARNSERDYERALQQAADRRNEFAAGLQEAETGRAWTDRRDANAMSFNAQQNALNRASALDLAAIRGRGGGGFTDGSPAGQGVDQEEVGRWTPTYDARTGRLQGWTNTFNGQSETFGTNHPLATTAARNFEADRQSGRTVWDSRNRVFRSGVGEPRAVAGFQSNLTSALTRLRDAEEGLRFVESQEEGLQKGFDADLDSGAFIYDPKTKAYVAGPGRALEQLPDGTPIPPEMQAGRAARMTAQNRNALPRALAELDRVDTVAAKLEAELEDAQRQVAAVQQLYAQGGRAGLRYLPAPGGGPGQIYQGVRPVGAVTLPPSRVPVWAPVQSVRPGRDPLVIESEREERDQKQALSEAAEQAGARAIRGLRGF